MVLTKPKKANPVTLGQSNNGHRGSCGNDIATMPIYLRVRACFFQVRQRGYRRN